VWPAKKPTVDFVALCPKNRWIPLVQILRASLKSSKERKEKKSNVRIALTPMSFKVDGESINP
jgi:ribosomal protein S4E